MVLSYLKDSPAEPATTYGREGSQIKREAVKLPKFHGDEKTAYLKYRVWEAQWTGQIWDYEEKLWAGLLIEHLDDKAREQLIGVDILYEESMMRLKKYYGDPQKVVGACSGEIRAFPVVEAFDYKTLVEYKNCITNNSARLSAANLSHEMLNTAAMATIVRKMPIHEAVSWQKYLAQENPETQTKPFPVFLKWLELENKAWELSAASGTGKTKNSRNVGNRSSHTFYGVLEQEEEERGHQGGAYYGEARGGDGRECFGCGEVGHIQRDCPSGRGGRGGGQGARGNGGGGRQVCERGSCDPPRNKKFHCAFHKGAKDQHYSSWSCSALKFLSALERIKLLKENRDFPKCCGDFAEGNCRSPYRRTCGGNKEDRGCGQDHEGHELFCPDARLCFSTIAGVTGESVENNQEMEGDYHELCAPWLTWELSCRS
jgi:hypothetical protein